MLKSAIIYQYEDRPMETPDPSLVEALSGVERNAEKLVSAKSHDSVPVSPLLIPKIESVRVIQEHSRNQLSVISNRLTTNRESDTQIGQLKIDNRKSASPAGRLTTDNQRLKSRF